MDSQLDQARLAWQRAQAELQSALAELEKRVADGCGAEELLHARERVEKRQADADQFLQRYITQIGKS